MRPSTSLFTIPFVACAISGEAAADTSNTSISLRTGYYLDDTTNQLSNRFVSDGRSPQALLIGVGIVHNFKDTNWSVAIGGLWGRGNESARDVDIIRQDDEIVVMNDLSETLRLFAGYRYEYTGIRTREDGREIVPSDSLPPSVSGSLLRRTESQSRHSLRIGYSIDVPLAENEKRTRTRATASLAVVGAYGDNRLSLLIDNDPSANVNEVNYLVSKENIWRAGPELTAGLRWNLTGASNRAAGPSSMTDGTSVELKYRGTFLLDRFSEEAQVTAVHGLSLSVGYRF